MIITKTVLSIAGTDPIGGAGIQADIKTMTMNGVYAMSVITAMVAQNTTGVKSITEASPRFLQEQLDCVFDDIFPDSVKVGMVPSVDLICVTAKTLKVRKAKNIVIDPVMVATAGSSLIKTDAVSTMTEQLFPLADLVTPNIPEAEVLANMKISTSKDMVKAASLIGDKYGCAVLLKGGHSINDANDLLYKNGEISLFEGVRINNPNTHGTGCTLSSAIASNLAKGVSLETSVQRAKEYISDALSKQLNLGKGSGPMMHNFNLCGKYGENNLHS